MSGKFIVLTGGVGGAKLVLGLSQLVPPKQLTAIVNTGDDFEHLGLAISPDIDTLLYTLSGKANAEQGWGRAAESWAFMTALRELGGEDWFQLGDGDLALHVLRTMRLRAGDSLSKICADFARAWEIGAAILPMSDERVATIVTTDEGDLPFQHYFVARRCEPKVRAVRFEGAATAKAALGAVDAILHPEVEAILIAPSNPYLSVDPILAVPEIRSALERATAPVVAVSPIVGGKAVKGPTAKLMAELGIEISPASVAAHYEGLIDAMLVDIRDGQVALGIKTRSADTLMVTLEDRVRVAAEALALARDLRG
ncbi:2-phospho-L-lactate transferase [Sphingopyxis sp. MG]|uniref:2-phospho-L-lactate transferase n=1 Tax=Sphingopyxis sp. MG TaxID=1866325 RepID=UPI000CDF36DA|nr:2-phospho-L-lactate transferase [Sphingopyxis sp. MG]AVA14678.1 2-phospho-L-lactate transferase [Sphingopyxis sp. MG]